jgi:5'-nucleotidase
MTRPPVLRSALVLVALLAKIGCSDDSGTAADRSTTSTTSAATTSTTEAPPPLRIMLTNDDGVAAPGIDALAVALRKLPAVTVTIVAPAEQRSGSGGKTTSGALGAHPATTASGLEATAVEGYPADTVIWAIDQKGLDQRPQLVVAGSNLGQNLGPVAGISGTVGAARAAVARGIPALAVSQGLSSHIDYSSSVEFAVDWVNEHRAALSAGNAPVVVASINSPTCGKGSVKGIVAVPPATDPGGRNVVAADVDCTSSTPQGTDDIDAFNAGYASLTNLPAA